MKRQPRNWPLVAVLALSLFCAFAVGGWIATKWVSPCVCLVGQVKTIQ